METGEVQTHPIIPHFNPIHPIRVKITLGPDPQIYSSQAGLKISCKTAEVITSNPKP
jgi:hypothetical protein